MFRDRGEVGELYNWKWVLRKLRVSLLDWNQAESFFNSELMVEMSFMIFLDEKSRVVSSAKSIVLNFEENV